MIFVVLHLATKRTVEAITVPVTTITATHTTTRTTSASGDGRNG